MTRTLPARQAASSGLLTSDSDQVISTTGETPWSTKGKSYRFSQPPNYFSSGSALFDVTESTLTIALTNDSSQTIEAIGEALSILTWDITDAGVTLDPFSAVIASGSSLVGPGATSDTDLSGEWAFKSNISAGSSASGLLGSFGIGAVGDINFGADTFVIMDRFDTSTNLFGPDSLNGIDAAIVGLNVNLTLDGFKTDQTQ